MKARQRGSVCEIGGLWHVTDDSNADLLSWKQVSYHWTSDMLKVGVEDLHLSSRTTPGVLLVTPFPIEIWSGGRKSNPGCSVPSAACYHYTTSRGSRGSGQNVPLPSALRGAWSWRSLLEFHWLENALPRLRCQEKGNCSEFPKSWSGRRELHPILQRLYPLWRACYTTPAKDYEAQIKRKSRIPLNLPQIQQAF